MKVELISKTVGVNSYEKLGAAEIIEAIARHGIIKESGRLTRYLMDEKHWSPLTHISYGFKIETRRSISAQIFRHKSLQHQEWSLRYSEPLGFERIDLRREHPTNRQSSTDSFDPVLSEELVPALLSDFTDGDLRASELISSLNNLTEDLYHALIAAGVAKECSRDILPLSTKTVIHITGTLRDLLAFLNVRMDKGTQKEARDIATRIGEELELQLPTVFERIDWRNGLFM